MNYRSLSLLAIVLLALVLAVLQTILDALHIRVDPALSDSLRVVLGLVAVAIGGHVLAVENEVKQSGKGGSNGDSSQPKA